MVIWIISSWYDSGSQHIFFAQCMRHSAVPLSTTYGWWELKMWYRPVNVGLSYKDVLNTYGMHGISIFWNGSWLCFSLSLGNCVYGLSRHCLATNTHISGGVRIRCNQHIESMMLVFCLYPIDKFSKYYLDMLAIIGYTFFLRIYISVYSGVSSFYAEIQPFR